MSLEVYEQTKEVSQARGMLQPPRVIFVECVRIRRRKTARVAALTTRLPLSSVLSSSCPGPSQHRIHLVPTMVGPLQVLLT
jgi:hypothetical protein